MEKQIAEYDEQTITFYGSEHDILLDTADVCRIAGIPDSEREQETDLGMPTVDLVTAISVVQPYDEDFAEWLLEYFAGYNVEVYVRPNK